MLDIRKYIDEAIEYFTEEQHQDKIDEERGEFDAAVEMCEANKHVNNYIPKELIENLEEETADNIFLMLQDIVKYGGSEIGVFNKVIEKAHRTSRRIKEGYYHEE